MQDKLKSVFTKAVLPLGLFVVGVGIGRFFPDTSQAQAQLQEPTKRKAFQSGGERSVVLLKEISDRLKTMDGRVANIETMLKKQQTAK